MVGTNDVWFVPSSSVISHWLGTFTIPTYPMVDRNGDPAVMRDVWAAGATVFAVGSVGTIQRWNGTVWEALTLPTTDELIGVFGRAADDVYAWSKTTLLHYDGTSWVPIALPPMITLVRVGWLDDRHVRDHRERRHAPLRWIALGAGQHRYSAPLVDITGVGKWIYVTDTTGGVHKLLRAASW